MWLHVRGSASLWASQGGRALHPHPNSIKNLLPREPGWGSQHKPWSWELIRKANSQALPQTSWMSLHWNKGPSGLHAQQSANLGGAVPDHGVLKRHCWADAGWHGPWSPHHPICAAQVEGRHGPGSRHKRGLTQAESYFATPAYPLDEFLVLNGRRKHGSFP